MRAVPTFACGTIGLIFTLTSAATAQVAPIELDTVRVRVDSRAGRAPAGRSRAIEVIGRSAIERSPATTLPGLLEWAIGVDLMARSPALHDVAIRGSTFEQVLVLVDGHRMRDGQTGHFNLNLAVPLDQIERIEILRGPASARYGSDAMAGVINIVTRRAGAGTSASLAGGSWGTVDGTLGHRRALGSAHADLSVAWQRSDGHRTGTEHEQASARIALDLPLAGRSLLTDAAYAASDFGADGFYGAYPSFETLRTFTASARWDPGPRSSPTVEPRLAYRRNTDDFVLFRAEPERYRNLHTTDQVSGEVIGRAGLGERAAAALGVHGVHDRIHSSALGAHEEWTLAASMELSAEDAHRLASTGVRIDRLISGTVVLSPAASFALTPVAGFGVRSSFGRSFRSPTWTERYYRDPAHTGNPKLEPERAWSAEIGIEVAPREAARLSTTLFLRDATGLIDWARSAGDPVWHTRNVDSARFRGLEAELEVGRVLGTRVVGRGAWISLTSSAEAGYESKYALRPLKDRISARFERPIAGPLHLALFATRERRSGAETVDRFDARLDARLGEFGIVADVRNALDARYPDIVGNPAPGRYLMIGARWQPAP